MKNPYRVVCFVYAAISLFLIFLFAKALKNTFISINPTTLSMRFSLHENVSGSNLALALWILRKAVMLLLGLSLLGFNVVNIISQFQKKPRQKLNVLLLVWVVINALLLFLVPYQDVFLSFYVVFRPLIATVRMSDFAFNLLLCAVMWVLSVVLVLLLRKSMRKKSE